MKKQAFHISSYSNIINGKLYINGKLIIEKREDDFTHFIKHVYYSLNTSYPRFFKMDKLSKLAFMVAEVLLKNEGPLPNLALVFSNRASSLDTDRKHQNAIDDHINTYPSPAVFVYTLPNICLGEISIKHKLYSENSFFIFNRFNASHLYYYTNSLLNLDKAEKVLCGWVDVDEGRYEALAYIVSKDEGTLNHNIKEIESLYKTHDGA